MVDAEPMEDGYDAPSEMDNEELMRRFKSWYRMASDHWGEWQKEAKEDFAFVAGDQWSQEDKAALEEKRRPVITFNRVGVIVESIAGSEINNRQEVRYLPREMGDAKPSEILTSAGEWFRDEAHSEDEESDAFRDTLICGMGWTETRLEYDTNPDGAPYDERIDPLEMLVDPASNRANCIDRRYAFRTRKMKRCDAEKLADAEIDSALLDASWAEGLEKDKEKPHEGPPKYINGVDKKVSDDDDVTIVQVQWYEDEEYYVVMSPEGGVEEIDEDTYAKYQQRIPGAVGKKMNRRTYYQAFLGDDVISGPTPTLGNKPSWTCITGKRDRNKGIWIGVVRALKDPQRWANKWLSQALHILNSNAKGGLLAETGAFADQKQAERSWAKADEITWLANGGMNRIQPKPNTQFPAGFNDLMQFAVSSIRDVSGVNLELLGQRDDSQSSGVLEYQRRQSAMTTLATLFNSLRRYRKIKGELVLTLITDYLSDGRLIRIVGQEHEKYVPLTIEARKEYDIIVDESASSPNEKERAWSIISQIIPAIRDQMTPEIWGSVIEYSPLPASLVEKVKGQIQQASQQPKTDPAAEKAKADIALKQAQMQADQQLEQAKFMHQREMDQARLMSDLEAMKMKAEAELEIARQKAAFEQQRRREEMMLEAQLKREQMALMGPTAAPGDETNIPRQ